MLSDFLRVEQRCEERVAIAPDVEKAMALLHAVDDEGKLEVDLHLARGSEHGVGDADEAGDAAVRGRDADVKIVEGCVPPRALRSDRAAERIGVRRRREGLLRTRVRGRRLRAREARRKGDRDEGGKG